MAFEATKHFALSNIRLRASSFVTADNIDDVKIDKENTCIQTRRWAQHHFTTVNGLVPVELLKTTVHLGLRLVQSHEGPDTVSDGEREPDVLYTVEASFDVDFMVRDKSCTSEELEEFVRSNAAHVAWPFWREHVFSTLRSASLPQLEIPLMAPVKEPAAIPQIEPAPNSGSS